MNHPLRRKTQMKKFFIAMLAVLFVAGAAYAAAPAMDFSGMINTRGTYVSNETGVQAKAADYMYYDMEFDADLKINPTDRTSIFLNFEIHDEAFLSTPNDSDKAGLKYDADTDTYSAANDDNIVFKRAFGTYKFNDAWSTSFGLMTGGAFGTAFGDSGNGTWRVRVDGVTDFGKVGLILQKYNEQGAQNATADYDAEADDTDGYFPYWVGKFGDVVPMVLLGYVQAGTLGPNNFENEGSDRDLMFVTLAVKGKAGAIGFEGEFSYQDFTYASSVPLKDYSLMGAYGNVWMNMDAMKVGAFLAYGSWDEDSGNGYAFGDDFYPGLGVGEYQSFGTSANFTWAAVTLMNVYLDYAFSDDMSMNANFSYWLSNETKTDFEDTTGMELTVSGAYSLAENVTYDLGLAYGQFYADEGDDPDPYTNIHHRITIKF
jgi:hypothetical protein